MYLALFQYNHYYDEVNCYKFLSVKPELILVGYIYELIMNSIVYFFITAEFIISNCMLIYKQMLCFKKSFLNNREDYHNPLSSFRTDERDNLRNTLH